jgi:signal peptidase II
VKFWTVVNLELGQSAPLIPGVVELLRVHNYGAAWSSFSGMRWVLVGVTGALMVVLAVMLIRGVVRHPLGRVALTLIIAGGLGNLVDRVWMGYVVDMFNLQFMTYPVFNVADICVVVGVVLLLLYYLFLYEKTDAAQVEQRAREKKANSRFMRKWESTHAEQGGSTPEKKDESP